MINLFKSVYVQPDNYLASSENQKRLIFTDYEFPHPFSTSKEINEPIGILDVVTSLEQCEEKYGSLDGFLKYLYDSHEQIIVVTGGKMMFALLITYWKSILANPSPETLYNIYKFFISNENMFYHTLELYRNSDTSVFDVEKTGLVRHISFEEFKSYYDQYGASASMGVLKPVDIPVEHLLGGYFSETNLPKHNRAMFDKVIQIVTKNIIAVLSNDRRTFYINSHNHYLALGGTDVTIEDPLAYIESKPELAWLTDSKFNEKNMDYVMQKYGYLGLKEMYKMYNDLFAKGGRFFDTEPAVDFLMHRDVIGLLEYDIQDEQANFFTDRAFLRKVNTLFISHMYQLVRRGDKETLAGYELKK